MFKETIQKIFLEILKKHNGNKRAAAASLGVNPVTFWGWINGTRIPNVSSLAIAMNSLNAQIVLPDEEFADYDLIRKVDAKAGAGSSFITTDNLVGFYAFRKEFLKTIKTTAKNLIMLDVIGESMEPLILEGDTVLVDTFDTAVKDGKIYLVGFDQELLIKRVQKTAKGFLLRSENTHFSDVNIEADFEKEYFKIYGRVRWFGRVVN